MEGAALPPPHQVPTWRYTIAALVLGAAGSMIAIAAGGSGTYRVGPLLVKMEVRPATTGTTEFAVEPVLGLRPGVASANTHQGFLAARATIVGVIGAASAPEALLATKDPASLAATLRDQGESAFRKFGIRIGLLTLGGGAAGGMAIALVGMKARRIFQGAIAGVVLVGILGLLAWQTYDIDEFKKTSFKPAGTAAPLRSG